MFADKGRNLPMSRGPKSYSTEIGFGLTSKHQTRLEKLARYKHSNLSRTFVNSGRRKTYNNDTWWQHGSQIGLVIFIWLKISKLIIAQQSHPPAPRTHTHIRNVWQDFSHNISNLCVCVYIYIYIYIYICVCVCVCVYWQSKLTHMHVCASVNLK